MKPNRSTSRMRLERMVAQLRHEITSGQYPIGSFLPSELDLCEQYELSKNTIRKGLDILVSEGLIEKIPRIGAKITLHKKKAGITIRYGYYSSMVQEAYILEIVERFNESHPGITVQPIPVSYPKDKQQLEAFLQNNAFDVMNLNLYDYDLLRGTSLDQSRLEPFEPNDDVYPFLTPPFTQAGQLFVMPFVFTPVILCYNKTHFREKGLSEPNSGWTWSDLAKASQELSEGVDRLGFYVHLLSNNRWPITLLQNGVVFHRDKHGHLSFDEEKMSAALQTYMGIAHEQLSFPNYLSENDLDAEHVFLNEKASIIMATYSSLNYFKEANFEYDIAPLPHLDELRTMLVIIGVAINKASEHKQAAKLFVDYLLSAETQLQLRKYTLSLPSVKQAAEWTGEELVHHPYRFHMYREIIHTFRTYFDLNLSVTELSHMRNELKYYWSHISSLEEVLQRIEKL